MRINVFSALMCLTLLGGCASHGVNTKPIESGPEPSSVPPNHNLAEFNACKDEALAVDKRAREQQSPPQYQRAAELFEHCVTTYSRYENAIDADVVIQLQALSILDYLKAGDVKSARAQLHVFKNGFPNHDLYLSDGSSFVDTLSLLLEQNNKAALLNTNAVVSSEWRRRRYWLHH